VHLIKPSELTKLYYSIGEVADMFSVSPSLVRFWETEFPSFKPKKDRRGDRRYKKNDILELEKIYKLVKVRGFTLEGARNEIRTPTQAIDNEEVVNRLKQIKDRLIQLRKSLD